MVRRCPPTSLVIMVRSGDARLVPTRTGQGPQSASSVRYPRIPPSFWPSLDTDTDTDPKWTRIWSEKNVVSGTDSVTSKGTPRRTFTRFALNYTCIVHEQLLEACNSPCTSMLPPFTCSVINYLPYLSFEQMASLIIDKNHQDVNTNSAYHVDNPNNKWPCPRCTYLNWPKTIRCTQCMTTWRRNASPTASASGAIDKDYYRTSGRDSQENIEKNLSSIAQAAVHSSPKNKEEVSGEKWWATGTGSLAKWACQACTYENWPKSNRCVLCYSPKVNSMPALDAVHHNEALTNRANSTSPENFTKPETSQKNESPSNQSSQSNSAATVATRSSPIISIFNSDPDRVQQDDIKEEEEGEPRRQSF